MGAAVSGYQPIVNKPNEDNFPGAGVVSAPGAPGAGRAAVRPPDKREGSMALGNKQVQVDSMYGGAEQKKKKRMKKIPAKPRLESKPAQVKPGPRNPLREMLGISGSR